jgi:hypothetical protein
MRPASTRAAVGAVAAVAVIVAFVALRSGGSSDQGAGTRGAASSSAAPEAADAAAHTVRGRPGCYPTMVGGTLAKVAPGALSLAVVKDRALLVGTLDGTRADRVVLDRMGAPVAAVEAVADALPAGAGITILAAAVASDAWLTTLTYAARRPSPTDCADGLLVSRIADADAPRRELFTHSCRAASLLVAAARGPLGIVFLDGATRTDGDPATAPAIADIVVIAGLSSSQTRVETVSGGATIAQAATAAGATSVAAAYVVAHGTTRELHVVQLGKDGKTTAKVETLDKANVGSASVAYEGDVLHVVWSSFLPAKNRFVLRWSKWLAGAAPTAPQTLGTGVLSAVTPSLAIDRGRFMLAWANGDEKATAVEVGASTNGVVALSGLASVVSTPSIEARDPVVALDGDTMFVAWKELGASAPEVHATSISCRE